MLSALTFLTGLQRFIDFLTYNKFCSTPLISALKKNVHDLFEEPPEKGLFLLIENDTAFLLTSAGGSSNFTQSISPRQKVHTMVGFRTFNPASQGSSPFIPANTKTPLSLSNYYDRYEKLKIGNKHSHLSLRERIIRQSPDNALENHIFEGT